MKQAQADEPRPSSAPPAVSASHADIISATQSPVYVNVTAAMDELTKRYMLDVAEYDHAEWLLKSGLLPLQHLFDVCDHLGYPRQPTESHEQPTQPAPLPSPAPANVTGFYPPASPPGISPAQSPIRQGITEHFMISTADRPAGPCALPQIPTSLVIASS